MELLSIFSMSSAERLNLVEWGGWILAALGAIKMVIWIAGEVKPGLYDKVQSPTMKKLFTGGGNRLIFGLGGFFTVLLGLVFVFIARALGRLNLPG